MCIAGKPKMPAPPIVPAPNNEEANREADLEAALRRRRAGAAANVLTGPTGIPSNAKLGAVK